MKNNKQTFFYFVADEGDNTYNVFSNYDFDENGYYEGHENEEGYHINDFDIVARFVHFQDAVNWIDKHQ